MVDLDGRIASGVHRNGQHNNCKIVTHVFLRGKDSFAGGSTMRASVIKHFYKHVLGRRFAIDRPLIGVKLLAHELHNADFRLLFLGSHLFFLGSHLLLSHFLT